MLVLTLLVFFLVVYVVVASYICITTYPEYAVMNNFGCKLDYFPPFAQTVLDALTRGNIYNERTFK